MNCQEITTKINEIKTKKVEFDGVVKTDIPKALILKKEIQELIKQLKEILPYFFTIEGKKFPVFKLEIGGKTVEELESERVANDIGISDFAQEMLYNPDFNTSLIIEQIHLVRLKVSDLGLPNNVTTDEIFTKAQELGLVLCPAEVGLFQHVKDVKQPKGENYRIAMKQISVRHSLHIFNLSSGVTRLWLNDDWASNSREWIVTDEFVFRAPSK